MSFKTTEYFNYTRSRPDRVEILDEWILEAINNPIKVQIQSDGRHKNWTYIAKVKKYLRVILLEDGETVHNAFFDRRFKEEK
jgi:hypothetical protein